MVFIVSLVFVPFAMSEKGQDFCTARRFGRNWRLDCQMLEAQRFENLEQYGPRNKPDSKLCKATHYFRNGGYRHACRDGGHLAVTQRLP